MTSLQPFEQTFMISPRINDSYLFTPSPHTEKFLVKTFHQSPNGDFRPSIYNPFEIKHRRRTSRAQQKILEDAFIECVKPSASVRQVLAKKLDMSIRGVQIWFQNRRAKEKQMKQKQETKASQPEPPLASDNVIVSDFVRTLATHAALSAFTNSMPYSETMYLSPSSIYPETSIMHDFDQVNCLQQPTPPLSICTGPGSPSNTLYTDPIVFPSDRDLYFYPETFYLTPVNSLPGFT